MEREMVKNTFNNSAHEYDQYILEVIPKYQEMTEVILKMLSLDTTDKISVLDIGIGTGNLSYNIFQKFPQAEIVGIDLAEEMLKVAAERLTPYSGRVQLKLLDFSREQITGKYNAIVSGLAIHHLTGEQKQDFYKQLYELLEPGGIFINRDVIKSTSQRINQIYEVLWGQFMAHNMDSSRVEKYINNHHEEDKPDTLEDQLKWLKDAGFSDVECFWKYYNYAVFGGYKG